MAKPIRFPTYNVNMGDAWLYVQKCKDAGMDVEKWAAE